MPLPLPNLDTRRWFDLIEEARAMIPRYAPGWTDHNLHDPGITLIELLAWLVEMDIYQLNRVPEAHRRKFLALVEGRPQPPRAAMILLGATPRGPGAVDIPAGAEFATPLAAGGFCLFRAAEPLHAVAAHLSAVLVQLAPAAPPQDRTRILGEQGALAALGDDPVAGAALWLGFDAPLSAAELVQLGLRLAGGRSSSDERRRIVEEEATRQAACRRRLPPAPPCTPALPAATPSELPEHHSVQLAWEFYANGWQALDGGQVRDETRALTLDGRVSIQLPAATTAHDPGTGAALHYLRVRLAAGEYDAPPLLNQVIVNALAAEQAIPLSCAYPINVDTAIKGSPPAIPGVARLTLQLDGAGGISRLGFDVDQDAPQIAVRFYRAPDPVAGTAGLISIDLIPLGRSDRQPGQVFKLPRALVQGDSLTLYSLEPARADPALTEWRTWAARPDFDASGGRDPHFVQDETSATITFGDGNRGRVPPSGAWLLASYRATLAAAGNLAPSAIALAPTLHNWLLFDRADFESKLAGPTSPLASDPDRAWALLSEASYTAKSAELGVIAAAGAAHDGTDAETLALASSRAVAALQAVTRAVTAGDHETLALATPGTAIARAHALPGRHPSYPCLAAPGVITVMIVPAQRRARPVPSNGLLTVVRRYLDRRRILGAHIEVIGPQYITVRVTAQVRAQPRASRARVQADVVAALNAFLAPLTGGPAVIAKPARSNQLAERLAAPVASFAPPGIALIAPAPPPAPTLPTPPPPEPGWPFGRDVYRSEVLQVIDGVAGVDHVLALELFSDDSPAQCGNLCVGPTDLVVSGQHQIEVI